MDTYVRNDDVIRSAGDWLDVLRLDAELYF